MLISAIIEFNEFQRKEKDKINNVIQKIIEEYNFIQKYPFTELPITVDIPDKDNIFEWKATFVGPEDTSYKGGLFFLKILFPNNFPVRSPEIRFKNRIYHPNVSPINGHISVSILNEWNPKSKIRYVLTSLYTIFYLPNPYSAYVTKISNEIMHNHILYENNIKQFTKKYANQYDDSEEISKNYEKKNNDSKNDIKMKFINQKIIYDENKINVIFETNGIKREIIYCKKDELVKNLFLNYKQKNGIKKALFFYKLNNIPEYQDKTLENINIHDYSLISVIDISRIEFS